MKNFEELSPGIILIGRFGWLKTGVWLFFDAYSKECVLLEMPDVEQYYANTPNSAWELADSFIKDHDLNLKFMTCTHAHLDHIESFTHFHKKFPNTPIIWHDSFFKKGSYFGEHNFKDTISESFLNENIKKKEQKPSIIFKDVPIYLWKGAIFETKLGEEPLFLFHLPKHSLSDTLFLFRGVLITGDWYLGKGDPNPNHIPNKIVQSSISALESFNINRNYHIHSLFSVHANEFRRNVDFYQLMEETRLIRN